MTESVRKAGASVGAFPPSDGSKPLPPEAETGGDDGALESIGKAVTTPIQGAAEDEEPSSDPKKPPNPPG